MTGVSETAIAGGRLGRAGGLAGKLGIKFAFLFELFRQAFETEAALRRPFLWLPVAAGAGVVLYLCADREPTLWFIAPATLSFGLFSLLRTLRPFRWTTFGGVADGAGRGAGDR